MKKAILTILSIAVFVGVIAFGSSDTYCIDPEMWKAMGLDPNASSASLSSMAELEARMAQAAQARPDLFTDDYVKSVGGTPSGSASSGSQASNKTDGKKADKQEATKITVTFTNMYGNVLGSSQVTSGTTIEDSQFVKDVPDCDGKKFDSWDYDGKELYHDTVVRANYK